MSASRDRKISQLFKNISEAAVCFESRWTLSALRRVDFDLHTRLMEQRNLTDEAFVVGTIDEAEEHGAAMCRGWHAAVRAMEAADEPDGAYAMGWDAASGLRIAVGEQKAAAERVHELHGPGVVFITPDEIAAVLSRLQGFGAIAAVKRMFPGAEVLDDIHPTPDADDRGQEDAA